MRPSSATPQGLRPVRHPSKFLPRTERIRGTIQVRLSFQTDGFLTGPSQLQGDTQPMNQMEQSILKWLPKTSFIGRLPIRLEILNASQASQRNVVVLEFGSPCPLRSPLLTHDSNRHHQQRSLRSLTKCFISNVQRFAFMNRTCLRTS